MWIEVGVGGIKGVYRELKEELVKVEEVLRKLEDLFQEGRLNVEGKAGGDKTGRGTVVVKQVIAVVLNQVVHEEGTRPKKKI